MLAVATGMMDGWRMTMRSPLLGLLSLTLAACIPAPVAYAQAALDAERAAAAEAWKVCMAQAAADLDDGVSDASTIATGVKASCSTHMKRMVGLFSKGMSMATVENMERKGEASAIEQSTAAVLRYRASAKRAR